jgi:hypothetical protein
MKIALISLESGRYLSAEYGGGIDAPQIAITANRENVGGYETFEETKVANGQFTLKTFNGNYVTADIDGHLRTNGTNQGGWETFRWNSNFIETMHGTRLTARIDKDLIPVETTTNEGTWEGFHRIPLEMDVPVGNTELDTFPRIGTSVASIFMKNAYDYKKFGRQLEHNKMDYTGINCLSAQWPSMVGEQGTWPHVTPPNNEPWDLFNFNQEYLDKLYDVISTFHSHGVHVTLTLLELYGWSNRKKNAATPDANNGPWRKNLNNVKWGGKYNGDRKEDDETLVNCPDPALKAYFDFMAPVFRINGGVSIKLGNEYPEKGLHERCRDYIKQINPRARIIVNRNEDTSGQYQNMKIGRNFDMIEYHGWKDMNFLRVEYDGPDEYPETFKQFFDKVDDAGRRINVDHKLCICNSDGARANDNDTDTYDWDKLIRVHEFCYNKGCTIDHQSQVKMTGNLDNLEVEYLAQLAALRG